MQTTLPTQAQVVIIGGGVIGCSVAYHLTQLGWTDILLLERKQLTSGTTWHAAGLVPQLRATQNMTALAKYTGELYRRLEAETGQSTGFRQNGSLIVAQTAERQIELKRSASMGRYFGIDVETLSPADAGKLWPLLKTQDLVGGIYVPTDGVANPTDTTLALAKGARMRGARIVEQIAVTAIHTDRDRVTGVGTDSGDIRAEYVVNCAGMWAHAIGRMCGVHVPLHAAEHFYIVTDDMAGISLELPTLRDFDGYTYYKPESGRLLVGAFEPNAKPWGMDGIPDDFSFGQLPEDWEHFEPVMNQALNRIPSLADVGIQLFFNGPESFTPDDRYLLGEAPNLKNFFVAAGFNSVGIQSAGGVGMVLAEWIVNGLPPMDVSDVDIRRCLPFQGNRRYLRDRTVEGLGLLYAMHWPFRQYETARDVRRSPLHDRLAARGACFGEAAGWERPNWYAPTGVEPEYVYSYGRQNWFPYAAEEHRAVRQGVGLFDQTSFAKFLLQGRDTEAVLNRVCANNVSVPVGKIVYTPWLNPNGGIEADLTVTRLAPDRYFIVTSVTSQTRDFHWLSTHIPEDAHASLTDVTSAYSVLSVMGPKSRQLLSTLTPTDLSNAAFPFGTSQEIEMGYAWVRASRITYVGELGWELYIPTEYTVPVYDRLIDAGAAFDLKPCGYHAMNSLRLEKGYRHWGHDITDEDTPLEAGLGFTVAWDKPGGFIGREALLKQKAAGPLRKRLVGFVLDDPEPLLYHDEPIYRDGTMVGCTTSGMFGHTVGRSVGLGYVHADTGVTASYLKRGRFDIDIAGQRVSAQPSLRPFIDPKHERVRG